MTESARRTVAEFSKLLKTVKKSSIFLHKILQLYRTFLKICLVHLDYRIKGIAVYFSSYHRDVEHFEN